MKTTIKIKFWHHKKTYNITYNIKKASFTGKPTFSVPNSEIYFEKIKYLHLECNGLGDIYVSLRYAKHFETIFPQKKVRFLLYWLPFFICLCLSLSICQSLYLSLYLLPLFLCVGRSLSSLSLPTAD